MAWQAGGGCAILEQMHYNLHERLKPKRHVPYKKILLVCVVILAAAAVYVLVFHDRSDTPPATEVRQPQ
jgi:hypothetical protein